MDEKNAGFSSISRPKHANITSRSKSIIKEQSGVEPNSTTDETAVAQDQHNLLQSIQSKIMENYILIWLKANIHTSDEDLNDSLSKLQCVINTVKIFTDPNECVDFVTNVKDEKVFIIISQSFGPSFISLIENMPQLYSIYVFDSEQIHHVQAIQGYRKVKGVFTHIESICDALTMDVSRLIIDLIPFSSVSITQSPNLDELDQPFMYTQLPKEIILEIEHNENAKKDFIDYYRAHFQEPGFQSKSIAQFQQHYGVHTPKEDLEDKQSLHNTNQGLSSKSSGDEQSEILVLVKKSANNTPRRQDDKSLEEEFLIPLPLPLPLPPTPPLPPVLTPEPKIELNNNDDTSHDVSEEEEEEVNEKENKIDKLTDLFLRTFIDEAINQGTEIKRLKKETDQKTNSLTQEAKEWIAEDDQPHEDDSKQIDTEPVYIFCFFS